MPPTPAAVSRRCPRPSIYPLWVAAVGGAGGSTLSGASAAAEADLAHGTTYR
ncbi:hypothetical protein PF005_g18853 [Phytophthora fragariae]|uniref:Uncharacterized protein n=2 Tax=Phytophthora TaxID=4783 RepID=A0A6A3DHP7_9STRA|nr:hypothetical protein PF003_g6276 [Phytophthora fragariae]KAE9267996.1 hypothetical protein PR003_g31592 [Phytophthora rubi]KAE8920435.1 hypothetical protein PF009_g29269 [Phytophthora fragariae]KAE8969509.1 hypothetical protein PF011_g26773 [Phytophthora fragariae]KAE9064576.1 hypothetical protein PF010_g28551 [Phytophthora fragariae]